MIRRKKKRQGKGRERKRRKERLKLTVFKMLAFIRVCRKFK